MPNNKGYTLIEVLVAIGIFIILLAAPTGFFVSALKSQKKALASQELIDNVSYTLEYISRALRMAKKDVDGVCIESGLNYQTTRGGKGIKFVNYQDVCQEFFWDTDEDRLKEIKNGSSPLSLTPGNLEVISFQIGPSDSWDQDDYEQPKVTILLEIKGKRSIKTEFQPSIKIQTTISQRNLDVIY
jgi:prepilin-type N-terminal cleavage/methylation domain-containing protein